MVRRADLPLGRRVAGAIAARVCDPGVGATQRGADKTGMTGDCLAYAVELGVTSRVIQGGFQD
jgi:hypothetical protein